MKSTTYLLERDATMPSGAVAAAADRAIGGDAADGIAKTIENRRIAIVNPWDNKFTGLYARYFGVRNEVRVCKPQGVQQLLRLSDWADVVWSQWCNEWLATLAKQDGDAALVTFVHSYEILTPNLITQVEWKRVDGILFVADHIRSHANRMWPQQLAPVPQTTVLNSVDLAEYPFHDHRPGPRIGYIGYLNHKKGVGLLLQCIKAAVESDPQTTFHIAGSFQDTRFKVYMEHLLHEWRLHERVRFDGWVENIPEWLKSVDYVISTSPWEGCPYNLIEAMACGVKPLIHNWQGATELFPGDLVFGTVGEFLSILRRQAYDSGRYRRLVEEHFNAAVNIPRIERFISECLHRRDERARSRTAGRRRLEATPSATGPRPAEPGTKGATGGPASVGQPIRFHQPLAQTIDLSNNRKDFTVAYCRGRRVLHIGCVDSGLMDARIKSHTLLHHQIGRVAAGLIGADVDEVGLKRLSDDGFEVHRLDLEADADQLAALSRQVELIVIPEVIEHLSNVGRALDNLKACAFRGEILISTPNAFSFRSFQMIGRGVELVHPDHNCYFSPFTLQTTLRKHGFILQRLVMYYWPTTDPLGKQLAAVVASNPYYAEGMLAVVRDSAFTSHSAQRP